MLEHYLIGTYTHHTSQGIYSVTLDTSAGRLSPTRLEIPIQKPIFMTFANNGILYTIEKLDQDHAAITSFKEEGGHFTRLSSVSAPGTTTAYLAIDEERQLLFSANYHMSTVTTYRLDGQGGMQKADQVLKVGATGPRPQQELPHVHFANLTPDRRLVICDLGMDQVNIYNLTDQGQLKLVTTHQDQPGFGDRHLTFGRDGRFMYLVGELSSKLEVLAYDQENGELSSIQTVSTIPADWTAHNGAAAIHVCHSGRFVYVSNRGENTIAVFEVQPDGRVKHIQSMATAGDFPRDFSLSHDQKFMIVANQNTNDLTLMRRDPATGHLATIQTGVPCPEPVQVLYWR